MDTVRFTALSDTMSLQGTAVDSLGSPVGNEVTEVSVADDLVAESAGVASLRARGNGVTSALLTVAGLTKQVAVVVDQVATRLDVRLDNAKPIITLRVGESLPLTCQAFDRNDFAVLRDAQVKSAIGTVVGEGCSHVAVQRSGYDTLQFTLGNATASAPIIVAAAPSVNPAVGDFAMADTIPGNPGNVWSPSAHLNQNGEVELYYTAYSGVPDSSGSTRGDLHRLVWRGGNQFVYDGLVLRHDDNICSPKGQGIENVVVIPRAGASGWRMLYAAGSNRCYGWQVFSAVSDDGRTWTKENGIRLSNGGTGPAWPPWPVGEGMVVDRLPTGEWRMITASCEHVANPENKWQITEWRSMDQLQWAYIGTVLTTRDMPAGWQGSVYSPAITELKPGLWRMFFTADGRNTANNRSAVWSAVSTDREHWQIEGEVAGDTSTNLYYSVLLNGHLVFVRRDTGGLVHLAVAPMAMP